jgi:hypothetical protein
MSLRKIAWIVWVYIFPFVAGANLSGYLSEGNFTEEYRSTVRWSATLLFMLVFYVLGKIFSKWQDKK